MDTHTMVFTQANVNFSMMAKIRKTQPAPYFLLVKPMKM